MSVYFYYMLVIMQHLMCLQRNYTLYQTFVSPFSLVVHTSKPLMMFIDKSN
jgi:hypothetical protein